MRSALAGTALRWLQEGLIILGILLLGAWIWDKSEAVAFQETESSRLTNALVAQEYDDSTGRSSRVGTQASNRTAAPEALGRIEMPGIRTSAMIAEGADSDVLTRAVGHVPSTAWVGGTGNVVLAGHRDTFFRKLGQLEKNDVVRIVTARATYSYRVDWSGVVEPRRMDLMRGTALPSLTLITCYPFHALGPAPQRYVVRATAFTPPDVREPTPGARTLTRNLTHPKEKEHTS